MGLLGGILQAYLGAKMGSLGKAAGGTEAAKETASRVSKKAVDKATGPSEGMATQPYSGTISPGALQLDTSFMSAPPAAQAAPQYEVVQELGGNMAGQVLQDPTGAQFFAAAGGPRAAEPFPMAGGTVSAAQEFAYPSTGMSDDALLGAMRNNTGATAMAQAAPAYNSAPQGVHQPSGNMAQYAAQYGPQPAMPQVAINRPGSAAPAQDPALLAMLMRGY